MDTAIVTALADNPVGRLVEDLMRQGGVGLDYVHWVPYDGVGRAARNGLNFVERGFGLRPPIGCSDRGHTAASQLVAGAVDWDRIFERDGTRWFHTGGIFAGLSDSTPAVALDAIQAARRAGAIVSYDANYRPSLWQSRGGQARAGEVNRTLLPHVHVLFGHEEDFAALLGRSLADHDAHSGEHAATRFEHATHAVRAAFHNVAVVATTLRVHTSASRNDWAGLAYGDGRLHAAELRSGLEIYDRVGGGDAFAAGLIYGLLSGRDLAWSVECGTAHGALAMTTPGDSSMATLAEVLQVMERRTVGMAR